MWKTLLKFFFPIHDNEYRLYVMRKDGTFLWKRFIIHFKKHSWFPKYFVCKGSQEQMMIYWLVYIACRLKMIFIDFFISMETELEIVWPWFGHCTWHQGGDAVTSVDTMGFRLKKRYRNQRFDVRLEFGFYVLPENI